MESFTDETSSREFMLYIASKMNENPSRFEKIIRVLEEKKFMNVADIKQLSNQDLFWELSLPLPVKKKVQVLLNQGGAYDPEVVAPEQVWKPSGEQDNDNQIEEKPQSDDDPSLQMKDSEFLPLKSIYVHHDRFRLHTIKNEELIKHTTECFQKCNQMVLPSQLGNVKEKDGSDFRHESWYPPVWNQGQTGTCAPHSTTFIMGASVCLSDKKVRPFPRFSILYNYFYARLKRGWAWDQGASIYDCLDAARQQTHRISEEKFWPFSQAMADIKKEPDYEAQRKAVNYVVNNVVKQAVSPISIQNIKACLQANRPVAFSTRVYEEFFDPHFQQYGNNYQMPTEMSKEIGNHAMVIVGYDNIKEVVIVRNSWGKEWAMNGHCELPYAYFNTLGAKPLAFEAYILQIMHYQPVSSQALVSEEQVKGQVIPSQAANPSSQNSGAKTSYLHRLLSQALDIDQMPFHYYPSPQPIQLKIVRENKTEDDKAKLLANKKQLYSGQLPKPTTNLMNDTDSDIFQSYQAAVGKNLFYTGESDPLSPDDQDNLDDYIHQKKQLYNQLEEEKNDNI